MRIRKPRLAGEKQIEWFEEDLELQVDSVLVRHVCTSPSIGTALHLYRNEHKQSNSVREERPFPYPWLQGFAYGCGEVVETGSEVSNLREGQLVYSMKLMAEEYVIPARDLTRLPEGLDPESASMAFQVSVALKSVQSAEIALGDIVLVTGQGPIGIFAAQFSRLAGAWQVITTDLSDDKLRVSRACGADITLNPRKDDIQKSVLALTKGKGADVVIESSGSPQALTQCAQAARKYARVAVIGWILDPWTINLADDFTHKGLEMIICHSGVSGSWRQKIRGAQNADEMRAFIFDLMVSGRLRASQMITHRFPFKDLEKAWTFIESKPLDYLQVLLEN
jgi:2-desacetyl-2-hydroxyethyl bacteriochlorophyllide A dehydrogenase